MVPWGIQERSQSCSSAPCPAFPPWRAGPVALRRQRLPPLPPSSR